MKVVDLREIADKLDFVGDYKHKGLCEIAREWCENNKIKYYDSSE